MTRKILYILFFILFKLNGFSQTDYYMFTTGNATASVADGLRTLWVSYQEVTDNSYTDGKTTNKFWSTTANVPGLSTFTAGQITVHIGVYCSDASAVEVKFRLHRVNSSGTIQESTLFTPIQYAPTSLSVLNFNITSTWSTGSDTDRFVVEMYAENTSGSTVTFLYRVGSIYGYVETPFSGTINRRLMLIN